MEKKISIVPLLREMKVGEEKDFPAEKYRSVIVLCSDYGFSSGRKYTCKRDRENRIVKVKRES